MSPPSSKATTDHPQNLTSIEEASVLFLAALGLVGWSYNSYFQMPLNIEFSHYGDIARSIIHGTYTSHFVDPMELAFLDSKHLGDPPWPVTYRFPLFAFLLAGVFKLIGPCDLAIITTAAII